MMNIISSLYLVLLVMMLCFLNNSEGIELSRQFMMAIPHHVEKILKDTVENIKDFSDQKKEEYLQAEDGPLYEILKALGFKKDPEMPGQVNNWMNSFLHTTVTYGTGMEEQHFNVILDSAYNLISVPANFVLDNCPEKVNGKKSSCKSHKMEIFEIKSSTEIIGSQDYTPIQAIDGSQIGMKMAVDYMAFEEHFGKAKFLLLNGADFSLFNKVLDAGAPNVPKADGIFSLAPANEEISSGMEQLLAHEHQKIATVYMQPFDDLDFFSKTKGIISIGELDQKNCHFGQHPKWIDIVEPQEGGTKRWKIAMEVRVRQNLSQQHEHGKKSPKHHMMGGQNGEKTMETMIDQQVLLSTMDAFIFAPKIFTDPLMASLRFVDDNAIFKFGRDVLNKPGLSPKDVMIHCLPPEKMAMLPKIDFVFGSQTFTIGPEDYILPLKVPLNPIHDTFKVGLLNWCHIMIRPRPDPAMFAHYVMPDPNPDQWLFGQLFFNKACVAFNYGQEQYKVALGEPVARVGHGDEHKNGGEQHHKGGHQH